MLRFARFVIRPVRTTGVKLTNGGHRHTASRLAPAPSSIGFTMIRGSSTSPARSSDLTRVELRETLLERARRILSDVDDAVAATRSISGEVAARIRRPIRLPRPRPG